MRTGPAWPVVVTRPEREAVAWVHALATHGFEPIALPLMGFAPPSDLAALTRARQQLGSCAAVMFVSPQAVHAFFQGNLEEKSLTALNDKQLFAIHSDFLIPQQDVWRNHTVRCWAPGPGTARALMQLGVPAERIDQPPAHATQFDSEALWPVVQGQLRPGLRLLVVRGDSAALPAACPPAQGRPEAGTGRDWLAQQCEAAGAEVHFCVAYRRGAPSWSVQQRATAQSALDRKAVWLLSSSESVGHLRQLLPAQPWQVACALATHPRIAESARALGFGQVWQSRPALPDVLAVLATLVDGRHLV